MAKLKVAMGRQTVSWRQVGNAMLVLAVVLFGVGYASMFAAGEAPPAPAPKGDFYQLQYSVLRSGSVFKAGELASLKNGDRLFFHLVSGVHGTAYVSWLTAKGEPRRSMPEIVLRHITLEPKLSHQFHRDISDQAAKGLRFAVLVCEGKDLLSPYRLDLGFKAQGSCHLNLVPTQPEADGSRPNVAEDPAGSL